MVPCILIYFLSPPIPAKPKLFEKNQPSVGSILLSVLSILFPKVKSDNVFSPDSETIALDAPE